MKKAFRRAALWLLVLLNTIVLLGQIWPAGAPPFARMVNIAFLVANLAFLIGTECKRT